MGTSDAAATPATASTGAAKKKGKRGLLDGILGGGAGGAGAGGAGGSGAATSQGTKTPKGTSETGVAKAAGQGATSGLPTAAEDGTVSMTFHQVNQDGAGPLTAAIDPTSGGTDESAFQQAEVTMDVPGIGIGGLSGASTMDFPVKIKMPAGMKCTGSVGGAQNVCVAKVSFPPSSTTITPSLYLSGFMLTRSKQLQNSAAAGPFGGSVAFTNADGAAPAAAPAASAAPATKRSAKFRA